MLFVCFRCACARALDLGRALPEKKYVFLLPSARIRLLPISEKKQLISGDKIPGYFFILLVFFVALINFFKIGQKFIFISSPSLTFLEICQMLFFYLDFSKNISNVFFFLNIFFTAIPQYILDFF